MRHSFDLLGVGIYSRADAARLLRMTPQRLSRWVKGYTYWIRSHKDARRIRRPPVVRTDLPVVGGMLALSFLELMEIRVVRALVEKGVPLQRVRVAARRITDQFGIPHPFAHQRVFTDHEQIFVAVTRDELQPDLLQVTGRRASLQLVAGPVLLSYVQEIDFDESTALAERWWPLGRSVPVVLDPRIAFGAPVIEGTGIRTAAVRHFARREPVRSLARAYEIHQRKVRAALRFENFLAHAA
ncbi:MAG: DUF433 domain-containing protein [Gemmatimonadetes bacterium]|nr:DUF433 domain-containing protein [Gemmatimonadota bacterium]